MKDQLIALTEAVRLARLELECYRDPHCRATPEWTVTRLQILLWDPKVEEALSAFSLDVPSPSIVADFTDSESVKH
jgi:hypothetical protein